MKRIIIAIIIFFLVILGIGFYFASISPNKPLIFFAKNSFHKWIIYSANYINLIKGKKICIIVSNNKKNFSSVKQLVAWMAQNISKPQNNKKTNWKGYDEYINLIFHKGETLYLSCGKTAFLLANILHKKMGFDKTQLRLVDMWSSNSLMKDAVTPGYLNGGHEFLEVYFSDLKKWVGVDAWSGIILENSKNHTPLSLLEVALLPEKEVNFIPLGKDAYGKGPKSAKFTNSYFRDGRKTFGYRIGGGRWIILFLHSPKMIQSFKKNFEKSYKQECIIFTDPKKFSSLIGVKI